MILRARMVGEGAVTYGGRHAYGVRQRGAGRGAPRGRRSAPRRVRLGPLPGDAASLRGVASTAAAFFGVRRASGVTFALTMKQVFSNSRLSVGRTINTVWARWHISLQWRHGV